MTSKRILDAVRRPRIVMLPHEKGLHAAPALHAHVTMAMGRPLMCNAPPERPSSCHAWVFKSPMQ